MFDKNKKMQHLKDESGQAALEYLLIGVVIMIVASALAILWHLAADGKFSSIVSNSASHAVSSGGTLDVFMY